MKRGELVALRGRALAFGIGGGEFAFERGPFAAKRSHKHRLNHRLDVVLAGVVRAELRASAFIQGAFKERAHDARLDELPVRIARVGEFPQFILGEFKDGSFLKQMAVEVTDFVFAESAALGHDREKCFERLRQKARIVNAGFEHVAEKVFRQQAGVFSEETKDHAIEKAGNAKALALGEIGFGAGPGVGPFAALSFLQRHGDFGEGFCQVFGDLRGGALRFEKVGILKQSAKQAKVFRAVNLIVREFVRFLNRAVEVGADDVAVEIADNEQGRIEQRLAVAEQLLVSVVEILFLALVFPPETTFSPYVGKAALAWLAGVRCFQVEKLRVFDDALLEAEKLRAGRVGGNGSLDAKQGAKVVEVFLVGR
ncbi:MAG: hypothetical protein NTY01_24835 [Verrucomicrobia bacterium]|nr:hypothetical protein [Verrucomicrobiota bacterium]